MSRAYLVTEADHPSFQDRIAYNLVNFLNEKLSGSGIDCGFALHYVSDRNIFITSSFHCMDDNGSYVGWQDFRIKVPFNEDPTNWKLNFSGRKKLADEYLLDEYLEDTIHPVIEEFSKSFLNS